MKKLLFHLIFLAIGSGLMLASEFTFKSQFIVDDFEEGPSNLVVTAYSSNPILFPTNQISVSGNGLERNLSLSPQVGVYGEGVINIDVTDTGIIASRTVELNALPGTVANTTWTNNFPLNPTIVTSVTITNRGFIIDNSNLNDVVLEGDWRETSATPGYWGDTYLHDRNTDKGTKTATFSVNLPTSGIYEVALWYVAGSNRATTVPVDIFHSNGTNRILVNQHINGSQWFKIGNFTFDIGHTAKIRIGTEDTSGYVIVDAVRIQPPESLLVPAHVSISWTNPPQRLVTHPFIIKRSTSPLSVNPENPGILYKTVGSTYETNFLDTNVVAGTQYYYIITWVDSWATNYFTYVPITTNYNFTMGVSPPVKLLFDGNIFGFSGKANKTYNIMTKPHMKNQVLWELINTITLSTDQFVLLDEPIYRNKPIHVRELPIYVIEID